MNILDIQMDIQRVSSPDVESLAFMHRVSLANICQSKAFDINDLGTLTKGDTGRTCYSRERKLPVGVASNLQETQARWKLMAYY